jgi:hypothetical protein
MSHPYADVAEQVVELLARPAVADSWVRPSALPQMTVGGLAAHLGDQLRFVRQALTDQGFQVADQPVPLLEHYRRSSWVNAGLDDDVNFGIRRAAETAAGSGPDQLVAAARSDLEQVAVLLPRAALSAAVRMPWWGWALTLDDFLTTRMMESIVHADDLAVSVGLPTPEFSDDALGAVLALLTGVAVRRHGQTAVVRALSRRERAPASIAVF